MTHPSPLWTDQTIADAVGQRAGTRWQAYGVSIDSRTIADGDLFIALKGPNHDGHDYVAKAFAEGAAAAIVTKEWAKTQLSDLPLIAVDDTDEALLQLARHKRETTQAKVIGITGSVGKTGTKESLAAALGRFGTVHKTTGNLNNHIGLPLTLARMPDNTDYAVLEMGMNHKGEIDSLSKLGKPDLSIITTVEAVHLEFFDSVAGIADAKAEIMNGMTSNGTIILNRDNLYFERLKDHAERRGLSRIVTFGEHTDADMRLASSALHSACSAAEVIFADTSLDYCIGAPGKHWVLNTCSVLAAVKALGLDPVEASRAFSELRAPRGRGAYRSVTLPDGSSFGLIDESYNASPASVNAAISVLGRSEPKEGGRRIAVLGDMLELGSDGPALHASLADALIENKIDQVYCCGPIIWSLFEALPESLQAAYGQSSTELVETVASSIRPGDIVTVKGSLGTNMAPIVAALDRLADKTEAK